MWSVLRRPIDSRGLDGYFSRCGLVKLSQAFTFFSCRSGTFYQLVIVIARRLCRDKTNVVNQIHRIEDRVLLALLATVCFALIFTSRTAQATVVNLEFSGTYSAYFPVFGLSGPNVPFSYELTYDTALNTNTDYFPTGTSLGGFTAANPFYGYSVSGITASSLTFGDETWTAADLQSRLLVAGVTADLWFNTDLDVATPTLCWIYFDIGDDDSLQIGSSALTTGAIVSLEPLSYVKEYNTMPPMMPTDGSGNMAISQAPEPTTTVMGALGLAIFLTRRRIKCKVTDRR